MYVDRFKLAKNQHLRCSNCLTEIDDFSFVYRISFVSTDHFSVCERCAKSLHRNLGFQLELGREPKWYKSKYKKFFNE